MQQRISPDEPLEPPLDAGPFGSWLTTMLAALEGEADAEVPCGECTACCTSSQFVHIAPEETATLARIPAELCFPAPGLPPGHVLLGYDERGHCPMFVDRRCSIYADRPRTCRTYDCRVFAAAGIEPDDKPAIAAQVRRWRFTYPDGADRAAHGAVRSAAEALVRRAGELPDHLRPRTATELAVAAVQTHDVSGVAAVVERLVQRRSRRQ